MKLAGRRVLVLGLGISGLAMARWCARCGASVRVADSRASPPSLRQLGGTLASAEFVHADFAPPAAEELLQDVSLVAISPGLPAGLPVVREARRRGIPVCGEIELFAQALGAPGMRSRARLIAITGTNGKTTTTALVGHLCRAAGLDAEVAGNIAPAALDALSARLDGGPLPQVWVLELSSFQLETVRSLSPDAATVLNVSDDHLDRYGDVEEYARAKARIFQGGGAQVLNRQDARVAAMALPGRRVLTFGLDAPTGDEDFGLRRPGPEGAAGAKDEAWLSQGRRLLMRQQELGLRGSHNAANALAALALCHAIGLAQAPLLAALKTFAGLPHRTQKIAEVGGVAYYDDSKGTNVGATVAALQGLGAAPAATFSTRERSEHSSPGREGALTAGGDEDQRKVILIAGGDGKGQDFSPLAGAVRAYARAVVLIGRDANKIEAALAASGSLIRRAADMAAAVAAAARLARPGDVVLLSPACASLDMYRDYAHRAEMFAAAVQGLRAGLDAETAP